MNSKISDALICVGRNVKKIRTGKGMSQQELAFLCGKTDRSTISNIERFNCSGINISTIVKISSVLGINVSELFQYSNDDTGSIQ